MAMTQQVALHSPCFIVKLHQWGGGDFDCKPVSLVLIHITSKEKPPCHMY